MPHLPSLRLLFPSPSSPLSKTPFFGYPFSRSLFSTSRPPLNPRPPLTVLSYSGARGRRTTGGARGRRTSGGRGGGFLHQRRGTSTLREERGRGRAPEMEEKEGTLGFNKRRAEGRDKSGKPKTLQLKTRKLNPVNTICYVQILGTGMDTQDTSPSVLLFFDKQRFIFNAGEGLQRFCTEHKIKLSKIDHIFFTRVCSETAGGLAGLLLTLAGVGEEGMSVNIWGPSDLNYLVDAMRSFIPNAAVVHVHSFGVTKDGDGDMLSSSEFVKLSDPIIIIDDEVVRIFAIPLNPSYSNGLTLKPGDVAVSYACELPEIKGKFDPIKAAALGLKPGPKYRELQLGNSVMSDSLNIMVHPSDVLGPSSPGPIILLVDCPTTFHMLELLSTESLNCYYRDFDHLSIENCKVVNCVIHLGPAFVTKSADYQKWMKRFGTVQHIMAGHEIKNMEIPILKSSARISSQLNYLCPQLFPAPGCWSSQQTNELSLQSSELCEDPSPIPCESILAENLLKFHLRPYSQLGLDRSAIPASLNHEEVIAHLLSEVPEIADVAKNVNQFWQSSAEGRLKPPKDDNCIMVEEPWLSASSSVNNVHTKKQGRDSSEGYIPHLNDRWKDNLKHECDIPACLENISREDMEIVLLGTGSSQPSKYRNVSSIFVNLFSRGSLLFDCGEGTLAQLKRRFGIEGADDAVKGLKCIWISHIHADHHTGLARILALRCQLLKDVPHKPLLVIGPRPLKRFLDAYSRLEDLDMQFLDCRHTLEASINAFHGSLDSREDHFPGTSDKDVEGSTTENIASHPIISSLFTAHSKMQSYWKRPGSPVDTSAALPVLMRLKEVLSEAGLEVLYSVPVVHCPQAFGVVLKAAERLNRLGKTIPGWKVVYSGDTRPCEALINASRDATLLIHEATFEDTMENEAIARNHSTTKEAVGVGTSAGAYRIILTHFSQRYPKIPVFNEADMQRTCIAFDLMTVNLADLPLLPKFLPYLKVLFRNELEADESDDVHESFVY